MTIIETDFHSLKRISYSRYKEVVSVNRGPIKINKILVRNKIYSLRCRISVDEVLYIRDGQIGDINRVKQVFTPTLLEFRG